MGIDWSENKKSRTHVNERQGQHKHRTFFNNISTDAYGCMKNENTDAARMPIFLGKMARTPAATFENYKRLKNTDASRMQRKNLMDAKTRQVPL